MQIFVLGMHRSGTSMVCRLINLMGAYFGPEGCQIMPNDENPKGFWERKDFRKLNDELLAASNCTWDNIQYWNMEGIKDEKMASFRQRARQLVFGLEGFRPWVTKEPRFCLTLPLFRTYCDSPVTVLVLRRPEEVASSLQLRNGFTIPQSIELWNGYMESAIAVTEGTQRIIVLHGDLLKHPMAVTKSIFNLLCVKGVRGLHLPSKAEIESFIDPSLHRSFSSQPCNDRAATELYDRLSQLSVMKQSAWRFFSQGIK